MADLFNVTIDLTNQSLQAAGQAVQVAGETAGQIANQTINQTAVQLGNQTVWGKVGAGAVYLLRDLLWPRLLHILTAPLTYPQMLWMAVPLVGTMLLLMFYFSRYKKEELGWNTAVGNSLVLIFVGMDLLRYLAAAGTFSLANLTSLTSNIKILFALCIVGEGVFLLWANFTHNLPKRFAFFISSPIYANITAYMGLVVIYSDVPIDLVTLMAAVLLFAGLTLIFFIMQKIVPESMKEIEEELEEEKPGLFSSEKKKAKKAKSRKEGKESGWVEVKIKDKEKTQKSGMLSEISRDKKSEKESEEEDEK